MSKIDFKKLETYISKNPEDFLRKMGYPGQVENGEFVTGDIYGKAGTSFYINLQKGVFYDFEKGTVGSSGKGWINLIAKQQSLSFVDAAKHIIELMGWDATEFQINETKSKNNSSDPIMPVPASAPKIPYELGHPLKRGSEFLLSDIFRYCDPAGELLHCVMRFETSADNGEKSAKEIRPLSYFGPAEGWKFKGPHKSAPTTLFGLELLTQRQDQPVLLVEGEKTAVAARKIFPKYVCVTWLGGASRLSKVDWSPLAHRNVVYWPDADIAGANTVAEIQKRLGLAGAESLSVVKLNGTFPPKWDLADQCPAEVNLQALLADAKALDLSPHKFLLELTYLELQEEWYHVLEIVIVDQRNHGLNTWRPSDVISVEGDASLFVEHLRYLVGGVEDDLNHLADMLAFMIQNPGKKLKSMLVIVGSQGTGKSYVGEVMAMLVGEHNCSRIETNELKSEYNSYLEDTCLVIIEELMALGRREITNTLKPAITQTTIPLRKKYANVREVPNVANFIAFTNHTDALPLDHDDRRYFVVGSDVQKHQQSYYDHLWAWTEDNYGVILNWLLQRNLKAFNPNARPPETAAKKEMTSSGRPVVETEIARMIEDYEPPFDIDLIEVKVVVQALRDNFLPEASQTTVQNGLKANGAKNLGQKKVKHEGRDRKVSLWAVRDIESLENLPPAAVARAYFERQSNPHFGDDQRGMFDRD